MTKKKKFNIIKTGSYHIVASSIILSLVMRRLKKARVWVELRLELGKEEKKDVERNGFKSKHNVDILKRGRNTVR